MLAATGTLAKAKSVASAWDAPAPVTCAYIIFSIACFVVFDVVAEQEPSSTLTLSALAQCLGVSFLWFQVLSGKGAWGISVKGLFLDGFAISLRLRSTLFVDGYLPSSRDGDYLYQLFDTCALLMITLLIRSVLVDHVETYQATEDTLRVWPWLVACCVSALILHGDMNEHWLYDTVWMSSLFVSVVAVLPHFWLITKSGGQAGAMTSHYIAAMAFSRFLSGSFAWMAWEYLTCQPHIGSFQHARWVILGAHILHVILLFDFGFTYFRSMAKYGIYGCTDFSNGIDFTKGTTHV